MFEGNTPLLEPLLSAAKNATQNAAKKFSLKTCDLIQPPLIQREKKIQIVGRV